MDAAAAANERLHCISAALTFVIDSRYLHFMIQVQHGNQGAQHKLVAANEGTRHASVRL